VFCIARARDCQVPIPDAGRRLGELWDRNGSLGLGWESNPELGRARGAVKPLRGIELAARRGFGFPAAGSHNDVFGCFCPPIP
jgi:hypothetical protein